MILYNESVLLVPKEAMVLFPRPNHVTLPMGRYQEAPLHTPGDCSWVLGKVQFSGGPDTIYMVHLVNNSHKRGSNDQQGETTIIHINDGD
jgi:hypothetical protein